MIPLDFLIVLVEERLQKGSITQARLTSEVARVYLVFFLLFLNFKLIFISNIKTSFQLFLLFLYFVCIKPPNQKKKK